jgi:hypothetical protein
VLFDRHSHFFALLCFALLCLLSFTLSMFTYGQSFEDNSITNSWIIYISNIPLQRPFFNNIVRELCGLQMICLGGPATFKGKSDIALKGSPNDVDVPFLLCSNP